MTRNAGTGRLRVHLDNRGGAFPLSVRLHGTDPEHVVRFGFRPGALDAAASTVLLAAVMVFGLTGVKGRLTRTTGLLVAVTMVALVLFWRSTGLAPAEGAVLVAIGGVVGFVGGLFVRR